MIGSMEIIVILAVILLLFGGKKLPEFAKNLGQGIREFKKAAQGECDLQELKNKENSNHKSDTDSD